MRRILIQNASVATMDPTLGDLHRADILIEGDTITRVGTDLEVGDVSERIDASQMIAIPGLVDAHRHTWQTALRGTLVDDPPRRVSRQLAASYRPDDMYAGNYLGALDCLNSGVTTLVDHCHNVVTPDHAHAAVAGLQDAGVRGVYGHGLGPAGPGFDGRHDLARALRTKYFATTDQLLRFGIAPQELTTEPIEEFGLARELDARIVFHADRVARSERGHDMRALRDHGLLGDDVVLVHGSFTTDEDWALLDGTGTTVAVCGETEMLAGAGLPAIREATDHTPGPALGIDCTSTVGGDMISHARLVLQVTRWREHTSAAPSGPRTWTARDALRWLTVDGARGAGVDDVVGTLTPGKRADVVLLDMSGVSQLGWNRHDPCGAVITRTNSGVVDTVLVDGRIVKQHGVLCHVDTHRARALLVESQDHLQAELALSGDGVHRGR